MKLHIAERFTLFKKWVVEMRHRAIPKQVFSLVLLMLGNLLVACSGNTKYKVCWGNACMDTGTGTGGIILAVIAGIAGSLFLSVFISYVIQSLRQTSQQSSPNPPPSVPPPLISNDLTVRRHVSLEERKSRIVAGLCPQCGTQFSVGDLNCKSCKINLAFAREHLADL